MDNFLQIKNEDLKLYHHFNRYDFEMLFYSGKTYLLLKNSFVGYNIYFWCNIVSTASYDIISTKMYWIKKIFLLTLVSVF